MKKNVKILILTLLLAMTLSLVGCSAIERLFLGGDPYSFSDIVVTQVGVDEFKIEFTANCGKENVNVYFTDGFRLLPTSVAKSVEKTVDGKNVRISFTEKLYLGEDYYLWLVNGEKKAKISITVPSMFPSIVREEDGSATFYFNYTYGTSWGSFCDATGKSVYKSNSPVLDDTALLIGENIDVTQETYSIPADLFDENCYYFAVSSAKEGAIKNISRPVVLPEKIYGEFKGYSAKITNDLKLQVEVTIPETSAIAANVQNCLQLLVKSDTAEEIYLGDCTYSGGVATMSINCTDLIFEGLWYDVMLCWNGSIITDVPKTFNGTQVDSVSTVKKDNVVYSIIGWKPEDPGLNEMMKIYFETDTTRYADEIIKSYLVSFTTDPVPTLNVVVKLKDGAAVPVLAITGGDKTQLATAYATANDDGSYTYSLPVSDALTEADKWYDLRFFVNNTAYEMLKDSCIAYSNFAAKYTCQSEKRTYEFREWNGMLKLMFTEN